MVTLEPPAFSVPPPVASPKVKLFVVMFTVGLFAADVIVCDMPPAKVIVPVVEDV